MKEDKNFTDFKSLIELLTTFNTEAKCSQYIALKRWGDKPVCPHCGNDEKVYRFSDHIYFKCGSCRKKFTVRVGTIFEDSKIPLTKWFAAVYMFASRTKPVSSVQLSKDIHVTQKSAWFMLHRLRYGTSHEDYKKPLEGVVEADESFIGGKVSNKHKNKIPATSTHYEEKAAVFGIVERKGKVVLKHVENTKKETLQPIIIANVKQFAKVMTDEWYAYQGLQNNSYHHATIKHILKQYVEGDIHTNTIENFWSVLKRGIYGIYHFTSRKHLQKYLEEFAYRFNNRKIKPNERFDLLLQQSNIGRLQYKTLIRK